MQYSEGKKTFIAGTDLVKGRLIALKSGSTTMPLEVVYAATAETAIGVTLYDVAAGEQVVVSLLNEAGTKAVTVLAAGATLAAGAALYLAASGKLTDDATGATMVMGKALEAAVDDDVIEVLFLPRVIV